MRARTGTANARAHTSVLALVFAITLAGGAVDARADDATPLRLDVQATPTAKSCGGGDAAVVRAKIAERLGRDPFAASTVAPTADHPARTLSIRFARDGAAGRWTADIALVGARGESLGSRSLVETTASCEPLVTSVVFTVTVLLEDLSAQPEPVAPSVTPSPWPDSPASRPTFESRPPPPPPPLPPARPIRIDAEVSALGTIASAPAPAVGVQADVGLDVERFRVELGGRVTFPASGDNNGDVAVRTRIAAGRLAPCYGIALISGCLVGALGSISGEAVGRDVARSQLASQLYAAAGVGALSRVFMGDVFFARLSVEATAALARTGFDVGPDRIWTLPPLSAAGTLGVGARLP